MYYIRGSRHDFDTWAELGAEGWSYKDVLPYFIKSESIQIPELQQSGNLEPHCAGDLVHLRLYP